MPTKDTNADSPSSTEQLARELVARGVSPLAAAGVSVLRGNGTWAQETGGDACMLFDLASVTKPMTAVAFARAGGDPLRRERLAALVPEAFGTASADVPVELFFAHRAGLASHALLYAPLAPFARGDPAGKGEAIRAAADARRDEAAFPRHPPEEGFPPLYSDLGYVLAGEALARAAGAADAGAAILEHVLRPLGLGREAGTVRDLAAHGVTGPFAPTETVPWRGGPVVGAVHDENAWALTGVGGSGHAGIFGTVGAVLAFGQAVLEAVLGGEFDWVVRERPGGTLRAGFDGKSADGSSAGARMGPRAFGHLGFTGTSLWIDPDARVVVALLTNRVCPSRNNVAIRAARPWAHDALFARASELR